jgi:hypothetical protein
MSDITPGMTNCRRCGRECMVGKFGHVCDKCVGVERAKSPQLSHPPAKKDRHREEDIDSNGWYSNARKELEDRE